MLRFPSMSAILLSILILLCFEPFSHGEFGTIYSRSQSSRSLFRALDNPDVLNAAVELNSSNFDQVLKDSPASWAIVEFFAHWCPACRTYKPQYEKVARLFNGPDAVHRGIVFMTKVDCASKINTELCNRFSVSHYPMLLWGPPCKFASGGWGPKLEKSEIQEIDDARMADRLLNWINKRIDSSFSLDDEYLLPQNASDMGQIARAVHDVEEATANAFEIILEHKMIKSETRALLITFFQLSAAHHPSKWCRRGSAEILVNFDDFWPSDSWSVNAKGIVNADGGALKNFRICGKEVPRGYWIFCRGSKNETRGFSCGLWLLLHSLSVRVEDGESHLAFTTICNFIDNFFICEECRQHFYKMCSSYSGPLNTTREFVLWLWNAHNQVNERLMKEEETSGTGDPKFPKTMWPPKQLCPSCYISIKGTTQVDWNKDEVFNFLVQYYGRTLRSSSDGKDLSQSESDMSAADDAVTSTNAVAVPVGAALAIAFASCAFGALACFWRSQQKNRKQRRSWN